MQVTVNIPESLYRQLTDQAEISGSSLEQLVVEGASLRAGNSVFAQGFPQISVGKDASFVLTDPRNVNEVGFAAEDELGDHGFWKSLPKL